MFAYIFISVGIILFGVGINIEATGFGTEDQVLTLISALGAVFKDTGALCGTIGTTLFAISEGWKGN